MLIDIKYKLSPAITNLVYSGCFVMAVLVCYAFTDDCKEGINSLPMYGHHKKCEAQLEADKRFLELCDVNYKGDRKAASKYYSNRAWQFYYQKKLDTAMFRFNQAWMLDSLNADTYWGFANLVGMQSKFKESLPLFKRALALNPANPKIWESAANSYGELYAKTQDKQYLDKTIFHLKKASMLDKSDAGICAQLALAYRYRAEKDSALKYLHLAEKINPKAVDPQLKKIVLGNYR